MSNKNYEDLLKRIEDKLSLSESKSQPARLEIPHPEVVWIGQKSIFRNFFIYPKLLRRESDHFLIFLAKELATAASLDNDRAIFIGRKPSDSFAYLIQRYINLYVNCQVCESQDTYLEKIKRLYFIHCEACGAKSTAGSR